MVILFFLSLTINNAKIIGENLNVLALKIITIIFNKSRRNGENMRDFEKISFKQFCKDVTNNKELYDNYKLPVRDSKATAGYDIYLLEDLELKPNEIVKLPTGIKAYFSDDEVLLVIIRSSMGFKYNIKLVNQVGVIDADYYNNENNEGHIFIKIKNEGENTVHFKAGQAIAQGIFFKYLTTESDNYLGQTRTSDY